jgi:hypothetical protein
MSRKLTPRCIQQRYRLKDATFCANLAYNFSGNTAEQRAAVEAAIELNREIDRYNSDPLVDDSALYAAMVKSTAAHKRAGLAGGVV